MIIVTGAAGFIGSCLVEKLNNERYFDLVLVDDFSSEKKDRNLRGDNGTLIFNINLLACHRHQ